MRYENGQRVALVYTDDPHTLLRPGDTGTVVGHDETTDTVDIAWDSGSRLSMCLDAGDRIRPVSTPDGRAGDPGTVGDSPCPAPMSGHRPCSPSPTPAGGR